MLARVIIKQQVFLHFKKISGVIIYHVKLISGNHPPIKDMFSDLRDGTKLLALLEVFNQ